MNSQILQEATTTCSVYAIKFLGEVNHVASFPAPFLDLSDQKIMSMVERFSLNLGDSGRIGYMMAAISLISRTFPRILPAMVSREIPL